MTKPKPKSNPNQENFASGAPSNEEPEVILVEVQGQSTAEPSSFRERAAQKLNELLVDNDNLSPGDESTSKRKRPKWIPKAQREETQGEFSTLVSSIFVLVLAASSWPEEVKPNSEEIDGVSIRVTKIILRHVDISGKLTGDVLDIIGIIAISAAWYSRVVPVLKQMKENRPVQTGEAVIDREAFMRDNNPLGNNGQTKWVTPIEQANPALKSWLDKAAEGGNE